MISKIPQAHLWQERSLVELHEHIEDSVEISGVKIVDSALTSDGPIYPRFDEPPLNCRYDVRLVIDPID